MNVTTMNNNNYSLLQQATCKLKITKCDENVIKSNNSHDVLGVKGQDFFLCKCKAQLVNNIARSLSNLDSFYVRCQ
jgi:hypothetical protein